MKTIIAAIDFSPAATNAAVFATEMAMAVDADLLLFHVCTEPLAFGDVPVPVNIAELLTDAEQKMDSLKKKLVAETAALAAITIRVARGIFYSELEKLCDEMNPYAVVMGSQGTTATQRLLFGSHAIYAVKHLRWPLVTVPPGAKFRSMTRIGLACEFEKVADIIPVDEIKALVNDLHAELHIINSGKKNVFKPEDVFQSGLLQEMLGKLQPLYHFITEEHTDEGIIKLVDKLRLDLLIVFPKRHSLLDKLSHKSHAKQLVLHSHVPVMALHQ